ncbi:MAG: hypothetical protein GY845_02660 [Planctomycetes bacterium]|nr:hypothetical protein [Planctomycetota bacterium]
MSPRTAPLANNNRISNSYALGSIHSSSNPGWIGGLTGTTIGPLFHCYAIGEITREWPVSSPAGGLIADDFSGSSIVSFYFLGLDNGLDTQLSEEQLKMQENFVDWDFNHIWIICEGEYPKLQWEGEDCNDL